MPDLRNGEHEHHGTHVPPPAPGEEALFVLHQPLCHVAEVDHQVGHRPQQTGGNNGVAEGLVRLVGRVVKRS